MLAFIVLTIVILAKMFKALRQEFSCHFSKASLLANISLVIVVCFPAFYIGYYTIPSLFALSYLFTVSVVENLIIVFKKNSQQSPHNKKYSQIVLEYAMPELRKCSTAQQEKLTLDFCIAIWNMSISGESKSVWKKVYKLANRIDSAMDKREVEKWVKALISRRAKSFHRYAFYISWYTLTFISKDEYSLKVLVEDKS